MEYLYKAHLPAKYIHENLAVVFNKKTNLKTLFFKIYPIKSIGYESLPKNPRITMYLQKALNFLIIKHQDFNVNYFDLDLQFLSIQHISRQIAKLAQPSISFNFLSNKLNLKSFKYSSTHSPTSKATAPNALE